MRLRIFVPLLLLAASSACYAPAPRTGEVINRACANCGTVRGIDAIDESRRTSGAGAVLGAVVGGVAGHQFGSGRGQDAATAAGAVGGAMVGNEMERQRRDAGADYYRVRIEMDRGSRMETINVADLEGLRPGDRVKLIGNNIEIIN